jgi:DNA polymerase-1
MENRGIRIDKQTILQTQAKVGTESQSLILSMRNLPSVLQYQSETSSDFNPNSHIQLRKILFGIEKLPITKYTDKTKAPSTDKEVLEELADSSALCGLLQQYNSFQSTRKFCDELLEEEVDSRIHTSYNLTIARTGRTSSKNPNMQNMPKGDKDPLGIRSCFVPDEGFLLVEADYNQHELRVLAEISGDSHLLKALQGDVHVATAATILGKQPANVTTEERRTVGKTFNFGLVYGMTSYGIMRRLGCSEGEAKNFLMRFFGEYSRVDKWMKEVELYVRKNHYVRTLSGRIRHFPSYDSLEDSNIREAINTPIQGTASDILLYSLIGIERFLKHNNLKSFLILQVHDSIVFNIHEDERACLPYIKGIMLNHFKKYMDFKSELQVDFKAGANWQDMKDIPV